MAILANVSKTVLHAIGPAREDNSHEVKNGRVPMTNSESYALLGALAINTIAAAVVAWLCWRRR